MSFLAECSLARPLTVKDKVRRDTQIKPRINNALDILGEQLVLSAVYPGMLRFVKHFEHEPGDAILSILPDHSLFDSRPAIYYNRS